MLLELTEQETRIRKLLSDPEIASDLQQYLQSPSRSILAKLEQYISQIEQGEIKIQWARKIDSEAAASLTQIYKYQTALTPQLIKLIEQAIAHDPRTSWGGYAWDLAWMSVRVGVEIPNGTIVFPCQIGEDFKSFACTLVPALGCLVFGTLPEILGTQQRTTFNWFRRSDHG
ncbi:hypothetical protein [Nostoc sp. C110]|uniref:hypothetical protein n=1 Tax=Nostoc sp. C110 TaxID=3349876 RepID=UPI00370D5407